MWLLRCVANEIINRSCLYFGEIESLGTWIGNWAIAKAALSKSSEASNLERGYHMLTEILHVCKSFENIIKRGYCNDCQTNRLLETWVDIEPMAVCGRLDRFVDRCRALQTALLDALILRILPAIEITGPHSRMLSAALSVIGRDVSIALTRFLAKAAGAPMTLLDLENTTICATMDEFSKSVLEFDQRLEEFVSQGLDLSSDLFECFEFVECLGVLAGRASVARSLTRKLPAVAEKLRLELQTVAALFKRGSTGGPVFAGRGAGVNMPPVAGAVLWVKGLLNRLKDARQAFDLLVGKLGKFGSGGSAAEVATLSGESDVLAAQLLDWRTQTLEEWSHNVAVSLDDLKGPLLRRKNAAMTPSADRRTYVHLQVIVNLPKTVSRFVREIKCASKFSRDAMPTHELIHILVLQICMLLV